MTRAHDEALETVAAFGTAAPNARDRLRETLRALLEAVAADPQGLTGARHVTVISAVLMATRGASEAGWGVESQAAAQLLDVILKVAPTPGELTWAIRQVETAFPELTTHHQDTKITK